MRQLTLAIATLSALAFATPATAEPIAFLCDDEQEITADIEHRRPGRRDPWRQDLDPPRDRHR